MRTRTGRRLIYLATVLSLGHHVDHVVRGNHVGWPLMEEVTPFTYSLGVYPLILLGLCLSLTTRGGAWYWALLSGPGAVFLAAIHLGPVAVEPPVHIVEEYSNPVMGWAAFAWMLTLIAALVVMFVYETHLWRRQREQSAPTTASRG